MGPVEFPEQNSVFIADGCLDLPALRQISEQFQTEEVISRWELSDEELVLVLKQMKAGVRPAIYLSVIGGQPPVALWVDEKNTNEGKSVEYEEVGLKEYRCSCGRLLGRVFGQAEIKCPKCGKLNEIGVIKADENYL